MVKNTIEIDGLRLTCKIAGDPSRPSIIFLHGITSHCGVWMRTIERLQGDFYCVAFDLPGFGNSDKPKEGDYSIAMQAKRVLMVADHFALDKFIVIGHSMGGQIATYLAVVLAPQRVAKLVSVSGVVTGELSDIVQNFKMLLIKWGRKVPALFHLFRMLTTRKTIACMVFDHWFYKPADLPFESWAVDRSHAMNADIAHATFKAWKSINATNLTNNLEKLFIPVLVIFGERDGTVPVAQAHLFKERLPATQLVLIKDCGHFPMYETFDEYIKPLQLFLMQ